MIKIERRRGRLLIHLLNRWKLEWTVEPRYWRNPLIVVTLWLCLPLLLPLMPRGLFISPLTLLTAFFMANIVAVCALTLTLQVVGTGRFNFGIPFFVVTGGYVAALLDKNYGLGPALTLPAAFAVGALVGLALSPLTIIARGVYFCLITLILPLVLHELVFWRVDIFGAETGIPGVSKLVSTGDLMQDCLFGFYMSFAILIVILFIVDKVLRSRLGLMFATILEDEDVAASFGIETKKIKVVIFTLTCGLLAIPGWFIAHYYASFAGTAWLEPWLLILVLLAFAIGGRGAAYSSVLGAYFVVILREILRAFIMEAALMTLYIILFAVFYVLPHGLWGLYRPPRYREYVAYISIRKKT